MQGLADGYFVLPYTIGDYIAREAKEAPSSEHPAFNETKQEVQEKVGALLSVNGTKSADSFHRELGKIMWERCGMSRCDEGLKSALEEIPQLREEFWNDVKVPGGSGDLNMALERAGRVADFLEFGELMCRDALQRKESCGGHFREESQTGEGEAKRIDEEYSYVSAWKHKGPGEEPTLDKEPLVFENVELAVRSYK
jgi:succinate dehydrogenase / fumarate reductase flavoprotein subunit